MQNRLFYLFTRTPLHVGAGSSVGAIDLPIVRERHTGFPIIPGSSLKGVLADLWNTQLIKKHYRATSRRDERGGWVQDEASEAAWLFGSDDDKVPSAGALLVGEARLIVFPIRSAKGSFAWITSPLLLARAARDGVPGISALPANLTNGLTDTRALFSSRKEAPLVLPPAAGETQVRLVLEDYVFAHAGLLPDGLAGALGQLVAGASHFSDTLADRLVIVSDGMMSFFAQTACEVAQHVRINDATGTADEGGLFNQQNVPADTLFYAVIHATSARSAAHRQKSPEEAFAAVTARLAAKDVNQTLQIGADATTGLGYCSVRLT